MATNPLDDTLTQQTRKYCGISDIQDQSQLIITPPPEVQEEGDMGGEDSWSTYGEESVLAGLNDEVMDDLTDEDGDNGNE